MLARFRKRMDEDESGFTLIELLVVILIIGILSAIAVPTFLNQRKKGWEAAAKSELGGVAIAYETWNTDPSGGNGTYVATEAQLESTGWNRTTDVTFEQGTVSATVYNACAVHSAGGDKFHVSSTNGTIAKLATPTTACP